MNSKCDMKVNTYNEKRNYSQIIRALDIWVPFFEDHVREGTRNAYTEMLPD